MAADLGSRSLKSLSGWLTVTNDTRVKWQDDLEVDVTDDQWEVCISTVYCIKDMIS